MSGGPGDNRLRAGRKSGPECPWAPDYAIRALEEEEDSGAFEIEDGVLRKYRGDDPTELFRPCFFAKSFGKW